MIEIKRKEGKNPELKASNMTKNEYFVIEKLYDKPLPGEAVGKDGKFEWRLYGVALHEYKTMDEETESMKVTKVDPAETVSFFKNAKSFKENFDHLPINTKVKVTQFKAEGNTYSEFVVEEVGTGNAKAPEPDKNGVSNATPASQIKALKDSGLPLKSIVTVVTGNFPDTTAEVVEAIYNSL